MSTALPVPSAVKSNADVESAEVTVTGAVVHDGGFRIGWRIPVALQLVVCVDACADPANIVALAANAATATTHNRLLPWGCLPPA